MSRAKQRTGAAASDAPESPQRNDAGIIRTHKSRDEIRSSCLMTLLEYIELRGKLSGTPADQFADVLKSRTNDSVYSIHVVKEQLTGTETSGAEVVRKTLTKIWLVHFEDEPVTTTTGHSNLLNFMSQNDGRHKIIIMPDFGRKVYSQLMSYGDVEVFYEMDLLDNIIKDQLQPKFQLLSVPEARQMMREYVLHQSKIAPMYENDPVAIALGLHHGDIVRIITTNEGSGYIANYRIVVRTSVGRV